MSDDVGMRHHAPRHIGMRVQRDGNRHTRADDLAYTRQQLAFGVTMALGEHRAV